MLDLYQTRTSLKYTSNPGIAGHNIGVVDSDIKTKINKTKPRKVYKFKDTNSDNMKQDAAKLSDRFLKTFDKHDI